MSKTKQSTSAFVQKPSVLATGFALTLMMAQSAYAQQPAAAAKKDEKVDKIEVTGTRIPPPNLEGASPVTVVDAQAIKIDGVRSVENLLNNLPQVFADQGGNISNGATGTATVNLRNLGADRTLVLVNGKRLPAGSPSLYAPDLNQIPAPLIKRIEILTGGASAVYGSDAVAGVVNFILNDKFEGAQFEVNHSFYNHQQNNPGGVGSLVGARAASNPSQYQVPGDKDSDGKITDVSMLLGGNFDGGKGNATVFLSYMKVDALLQSERDYSACALGSSAAGFSCGGSATSFPGAFTTDFVNIRTVADAAGNTRPYSGATDAYNYGPLNYYQRPTERYGAFASATYDALPNARVYADVSFHDDRSLAQIAPSGSFTSQTYPIRFENPLLSAAWRSFYGLTAPGQVVDTFIARRNVEGGGRIADLRHTSYRFSGGVKGEVAKFWNYDVYAQTAKVVYQQSYRNEFSKERTTRALDVVTDPATGQPVCASVLNGVDTRCVPYNIWRLGGVTPEALAYVSATGFQKGFTSQQIQGATMAADLGNYGIKFPTSKEGIGVAFGFERRSERLELETDRGFETDDLFGQGGPTIGLAGGYNVKEFFGEFRAPIVERQPFIEMLSINGSVRTSDYSTGKKTDSFGLGIEWSPTSAVRVRGSYQEAVRAANIIELFAAQGLGLYDNDDDPCSGAAPARSLADCQRTGVTAAQYGRISASPAGQYNQLTGGNPNLKPEEAKSQTLGLVLTPTRNLSASIDYYKIEVEDTIGTVPPTVALQQCLDTGNPLFCGLITRDRTGSLWALSEARILATNQNVGTTKTEGWDFGVNYTHKLGGLGSLAFSFTGTLLKKFEVEPVKTLGKYDCAGLYGPNCGTPLPEWRHKFRTTWNTPWNVDLSLTWRHFDSVLLDRTSSNRLLTGTVNSVDRELGKRDYIDVAGTWNASKNFTVSGGINNLLDKDPPLSAQVGAGFGNGNTYPQVYDALGRRVFLNLTAKF